MRGAMTTRPPLPGRIKICGLSTPETLDAALLAGADMVGLVRFPRSPRHVDLDAAAALAERARGRACVVALVVNAEDEELAALAERVRPDLLQLHGAESPERAAAIARATGIPVMKAIGIGAREDLAAIDAYRAAGASILLDAKPPKDPAALPGGNGLAFDWRLLADLDPSLSFMLSGGLTAGCVADAIALTRAQAVDVSSGVESAPGAKDVSRIADFVAAARSAYAKIPSAKRMSP